jgi:hypothetical protein
MLCQVQRMTQYKFSITPLWNFPPYQRGNARKSP